MALLAPLIPALDSLIEGHHFRRLKGGIAEQMTEKLQRRRQEATGGEKKKWCQISLSLLLGQKLTGQSENVQSFEINTQCKCTVCVNKISYLYVRSLSALAYNVLSNIFESNTHDLREAVQQHLFTVGSVVRQQVFVVIIIHIKNINYGNKGSSHQRKQQSDRC